MYEKAAKYRDFRQMLDKEKGIDAITVSTPDHNHAVIAMAAMKMGKHVFVQKPLTHTIKEARLLAEAAKKRNVVTQMGNQGHSKEGARLDLRVDLGRRHRRRHRGPLSGPTGRSGRRASTRPRRSPPSRPPSTGTSGWAPPPGGPTTRPISPFDWRGWWDFGTGALGDMGAHLIDQPFWALKLGHPTTVQASSTEVHQGLLSRGRDRHLQVPGPRQDAPGQDDLVRRRPDAAPARPSLENGRMMGDDGGGCLFVGTKGMLMCCDLRRESAPPAREADAGLQAAGQDHPALARHHGGMDRGHQGRQEVDDRLLAYSGPLTEVMLLGNVAVRFKDQEPTLQWDPVKMEFPNLPEANPFVH